MALQFGQLAAFNWLNSVAAGEKWVGWLDVSAN